MTWDEYMVEFDKVLDGTNQEAPYDKIAYREYVKLNQQRINRWLKRLKLEEDVINTLKNIQENQKWILITEPWCGDAAHISPVLKRMAEANENIEFIIDLRDGDSGMIDQYLTNGTKSIPKLVVRDANGEDLFTWGSRPAECQKMVMENKEKNLSNDEKNLAVQTWYNRNKGIDVQKEICELLMKS